MSLKSVSLILDVCYSRRWRSQLLTRYTNKGSIPIIFVDRPCVTLASVPAPTSSAPPPVQSTDTNASHEFMDPETRASSQSWCSCSVLTWHFHYLLLVSVHTLLSKDTLHSDSLQPHAHACISVLCCCCWNRDTCDISRSFPSDQLTSILRPTCWLPVWHLLECVGGAREKEGSRWGQVRWSSHPQLSGFCFFFSLSLTSSV